MKAHEVPVQPSGPCVTQLPDDLDHSTSQALAAFLHPQGGGGVKAIHLVRTKESSNFVVADFFFLQALQQKCVSSLGDVILATKSPLNCRHPSGDTPQVSLDSL